MRNRMRLLMSAVLVGAMSMGMVATASAEAETADKITLFQSKTEIQDALADCVEAFQEETGIEVEVWETAGDEYIQQLEQKLANNSGPTIFTQESGSGFERRKDYCADLSDVEVMGSIPESLLAPLTDGDKMAGIPYTVEGFGIVYNKNLCDASSLTSVEDLENLITEQNEAGVEGFELSSEDYFLIGHILSWPFSLMDDPDQFIDDLYAGETTMAEQPIFQEFADLMVFIRDNCQNPLEQNYDGEVGDLATDRAAMIHQGNWVSTMFADYEFDTAGLAPLPLGGNDKLAVSVPSYWAVNAMASEEEQAAAKVFLNWLYNSETGKHFLYDEFLFVPVVDGDTNDNLDPLAQTLQEYVAADKTVGWYMNDWPANSVNVYFAPVTEEFFTTDMDAAGFLAALDGAFAEAVANQG